MKGVCIFLFLFPTIYSYNAKQSSYSLQHISMLPGFIFLTCWKLKAVLDILVPFIPLNIIIGVDNYTLRNGTEQSLVMAKQTFSSKSLKRQVPVQEDKQRIHTYIHVGRHRQTNRRSHTYLHTYTWAPFFANPPPPLASYLFHLVFGSYIRMISICPSVCLSLCNLLHSV